MPVVDASCPLVLIAQQNRSGGTLLAQLLDGHPQLNSHPPELKIGQTWPRLDPSLPPKALFSALREKSHGHWFEGGYRKDAPARRLGLVDQFVTLPFGLDPREHRARFVRLARERPPRTQRDVLDIYFTTLFEAWADNQNAEGDKKWTVVFRGELRKPPSLAGFFADYPDGRHITIVREPKAAFASWSQYIQTRRDPASGGWPYTLKDQMAAIQTYGERVFLLTFEQLVTRTEHTMRRLSEWLGVGFDPILLAPTFNRMPIKANSSFRIDGFGVQRAPLDNWRSALTPADAAAIDERLGGHYAKVVELAEAPLTERAVLAAELYRDLPDPPAA